MGNGVIRVELQGLVDRLLALPFCPSRKSSAQARTACAMELFGLNRMAFSALAWASRGKPANTWTRARAIYKAGILRRGFDRLLVGFNGLGQFSILEECLGFVASDSGERVGVGVASNGLGCSGK
jgi:hypothetical protein